MTSSKIWGLESLYLNPHDSALWRASRVQVTSGSILAYLAQRVRVAHFIQCEHCPAHGALSVMREIVNFYISHLLQMTFIISAVAFLAAWLTQKLFSVCPGGSQVGRQSEPLRFSLAAESSLVGSASKSLQSRLQAV